MDYVALGRRIRNERVARKWTRIRLANEIKLSNSFLAHIERGSRKASLETIVAIANAMQVSLEYLLSDSLVEVPHPGVYDPLNPHQRRVLREIVQHIGKDLDKWAEDPADRK